jgi:hypothetical protein
MAANVERAEPGKNMVTIMLPAWLALLFGTTGMLLPAILVFLARSAG